MNGYSGKMLMIDLTDRSIVEKEITRDLAQHFIGGYGIGAKLLYEMIPKGADPLGPDNVMGFITGPASATKSFFGGRYTTVHKSPVTGGWNDANSGGYFGPELKKAGFDALFVSGAADTPVYIYINDGAVEIRDASHLWGMDTKEVWSALKEETGESKLRVSAIGPAGEHQSLIACPINDGHRAPGRGGGGAVMGSKNLKAVAVRGTREIPVADPDRVTEINRSISEFMKTAPFSGPMGTYGTGVGTTASALNGDSPVKNWGGAGIVDYPEEEAAKNNSILLEKHKIKKYNCANCPLGCGALMNYDEGRWPLEETERPEYETLAAFGSTLLCSEMDALMKCNEICNTYGFDTISAGMTIAWAMECYHNGVLSKEELDGIDLTWGNGEAIVTLLQKMAEGEGCGAILANGSVFAADHWNKGRDYLQTASGIELPMHDPRFAPGLARTYKYDPTPGRHVKGGLGALQMISAAEDTKYNYSGTGEADLQETIDIELLNVSSLCYIGKMVMPPTAQNELIAAVTGFDMSDEQACKTGLRIFMMRHAFNLREGLKPSDFTLSERAVGRPPLEAGPLAGISVDVEQLSQNFFEAASIDPITGKPDLAKLKELGHLDEVIRDLYQA